MGNHVPNSYIDMNNFKNNTRTDCLKYFQAQWFGSFRKQDQSVFFNITISTIKHYLNSRIVF